MKILGIDSSTPMGSAAILQNQQILSQFSLNKSSTSSESLLMAVDRVLSESSMDLADLDGFGVTTGPGSFTGLRVGVSLVKGFILSTRKPFRGIDTLEAVAALTQPSDYQICAILDARKKEVYSAFFRYENQRLKRSSPDRALRPEELCEQIQEPTVFIGSGLDTYGEFLRERLGSRFVQNPETRNYSVAASTALLTDHQFEKMKRIDLNDLNVQYVRKSEAELKFKDSIS